MPKNGYLWDINKPPRLERHSLAKHRIIHDYLVSYIKVLCANPRIDDFKISLIDGFSGGGIYLNENDNPVDGSPLIMLCAVKEAEAVINLNRREQGLHRQLSIQSTYYFIDKDQKALFCLESLIKKEFNHELNHSVHLIQGKYEEHANDILNKIESRDRAQRSIFLLDQYGYTDVPVGIIHEIFRRIRNPEVLFTFAIDCLTAYLSENTSSLYEKSLKKAGLYDALQDKINIDKKYKYPDWLLSIQAALSEELQIKCNARYYTPFFILSDKSHRSYWFVHFSNHIRANEVMKELHWSIKNHFRHFGRPGLQMLMYDPRQESLNNTTDIFGFKFDEHAKEQTQNALLDELPKLIYPCSTTGIRYGDLQEKIGNFTPACARIYNPVLNELLKAKEIKIVTADGREKRKATRLKSDDILRLPPQGKLFLLGSDKRF